MGLCCGGSAAVGADEEGKDPMKADGPLKDGPVIERGCTDVPCCILFIAHWVLFVVVSLMGLTGGDPTKLYVPRDFTGSYCSASDNWNGGPDLSNHPKLLYMMNVSTTVEPILDTFVCSNTAQSQLSPTGGGLMTAEEYSTYECTCCISPCSACSGSGTRAVFASQTALASQVTSSMGDLTDPSKAANLWSSGLSGIMSEVTKYFVTVCVTDCADVGKNATRAYVFEPTPDHPLYRAFYLLKNQGPATLQTAISSSFTFSALPKSLCPYDTVYCIPFPGLEFTEVAAGYCTFRVAADVTNMVGGTFDSLGGDALAGSMTENFGSAMGDVIQAMDAFIVTAIWAFVVGLVFMILLRLFVGVLVWTAILCVFLAFMIAGICSYVRSGQCAGDSFTSSATATGVSTAAAASAAAMEVDTSKESFTGTGEDYRGIQSRTRGGRTCQAWAAQSPHAHTQTGEYLESNYCRNPGGTASSIWCFTTDPETRWDLCTPVGQISATCPNGYAVDSKDARKALEILAYIAWGMGAIWFVCVLCFSDRINLAISLNKAAAEFIAKHWQVVYVPLVQGLITIIWMIVWAFLASFILSQVPDGYTPTDSYATYAEAYGTATVPGKCTDKWPTGGVYRTYGDATQANDPCSGNMGDTSGITPKCWKCSAPRYVFDYFFAYSFFSFLWNNAFLIALGQCIIAGAVGVYFFTPHTQKGNNAVVMTSLKNTFYYHTGSLAFGSLIIAIVQMIRYTMKYLEKQAAAQKNQVMVYVFKCVGCCIWCFERCLKFLNKHAYIQIALLGKNFCVSAKNAFFLIARNAIRFAVVISLGVIVRGIGFFFITAMTAGLGYFILMGLHPDITPVMPMMLFIAIGYVVAKLYMNVFELSVDTMLQCVIATEEMGGDRDGDGSFVPTRLKRFVDTNCK
eukprot:TRINITY_DN9922_c0_g1_i1.p1 TRINITY_DN9922_c0_g1~~TRINITY_DN9922_c0_g1_i1.p1  ORF type:complete len:910 (-),score=122.40 TRINITY_DN9922_c0_g1_i1:321-3050(-)